MGAIAAMGRSYGRKMISLIVAASENNVIGVQGELRYNEPMSRHTSWRAGGPADVFFIPASIPDLAAFLRDLDHDTPVFWLGVGSNLLDGEAWSWIVAGSYFNYAVLEPDQVIVTFPNGLFEVRDWDYRLLPKPVLRGEVLQSVSEQNARFFKN